MCTLAAHCCISDGLTEDTAKYLKKMAHPVDYNIMDNINKDLDYWRKNAEEDYIKTPLSVLKYITELEQENIKRKRKHRKKKKELLEKYSNGEKLDIDALEIISLLDSIN